MKLFIPFLMLSVSLIGLSFSALSQSDTTGMNHRLQNYVRYLASDSLKGRSTGTPEELEAGNFFLKNTKTTKKSPIYKWKFQATKKDSTVVTTRMFGRFINNKSPYTIIIGAHIDHIGYGDDLSLSHKETGIHNGADDNASGVAALIELHNRLIHKKLPFNLLIVPFTAHEIGTYGSAYLANHLPKKAGNIICMLNMDMIGRMHPSDSTLYISESQELFDKFTFQKVKIVLSDQKKVNQLDSKHFVAKGIPSATFTTGMHTDYHKISDDETYINYRGIALTLLLIEYWIENSAPTLLPN